MWIYVPDEKEKEAWHGTIARSIGSKGRWKFELIRHAELKDLYSTTPFDSQKPVIGLLDHQTRCTVVRPMITHIDPGSAGVLLDVQRTRVEGECDALLTGLVIRDPSEKLFRGLKFISEAFTAWYAAPAYQRTFDFAARIPEVSFKADESKRFHVVGFGTVECTTGARFADDGVHTTSINSSSLFSLTFDQPKSLDETQSICFGLERLFGFLIGHRGPLPEFTVWHKEQYAFGEHKLHYEAKLEIGGADFVDEKPPHPMRCIHLARGVTAMVEMIVGNFLRDRGDLLTRIHAVEFCRFFTTNLNDRFSVLMPVLEEYLKKKYTHADEISYIQHRTKFFDYVEASDDEEIKKFSYKHLSVKTEKAPSLKTLIERALSHLNRKGYNFPSDLAKRIHQRRGKVFHSSPDMTADDVIKFGVEIAAAVAILLLHTFEDLGIDPADIADQYSAMSDIAIFMKKPTPPKPDPSSPMMTPAEAVNNMDARDPAKSKKPAQDQSGQNARPRKVASKSSGRPSPKRKVKSTKTKKPSRASAQPKTNRPRTGR